MSAPTFARLREAAQVRLFAAAGAMCSLADEPAAQALASVLALADARLEITPQSGRLAPTLTCHPDVADDELATSLLDHLREAMTAPLLDARASGDGNISAYVDDAGFVELQTLLLRAGATIPEVGAVTDLASTALRDLVARLSALANAHFTAITQRDLGYTPGEHRRVLLPLGVWALAPETAGEPNRETILLRRRQAIDAYGALASLLHEPVVTAAIDQAKPLAPVLAERLGIPAAALRRLQGARRREAALGAWEDRAKAVVELVAHAAPIAEWPQGAAWEATAWQKAAASDLLPPAFLADTQVKDALAALAADLLRPLAAECARRLGVSRSYQIERFIGGFELPAVLIATPARRRFLAGVRAAVAGERSPAGFAEAAVLWHRRAACAAAMRHESTTDRPGWPACCAPWTSPDGRFTIVPLTSADALVDEGNALDHCVGGYYDHCRRGDTHILSLRVAGARAATIELVMAPEADGVRRLEVGQFKAHRNRRPEPPLVEAMQAFVADLRSGAHPIARAELVAYAKRMHAGGDYAWRSGPLPFEHARRAWPLYRALLPRRAPADIDRWADETGLAAGIDGMLRAIAAAATTPAVVVRP